MQFFHKPFNTKGLRGEIKNYVLERRLHAKLRIRAEVMCKNTYLHGKTCFSNTKLRIRAEITCIFRFLFIIFCFSS
ncbi:hypothetical protein bcgnr5372_40560 [Bacillus luti]